MIKILKYQYLSVLWAVLVLYLCDMPMSPDTGGGFFEGFDKLSHTGFFFVFTVFMLFGHSRQRGRVSLSFMSIVLLCLISVVLGGGIELLQWKVFTYRSADWWDFFCDVTGTGMAAFAYLFFANIRGKSHE